MYKHLVKLADFLDERDLVGYAKVVDGFIGFAKLNFPFLKAGNITEADVLSFENDMGTRVNFSPTKHPLALQILKVLIKILILNTELDEEQNFELLSPEEEKGRDRKVKVIEPGEQATQKGEAIISAVELENIFKTAVRHDGNLKEYPTMDEPEIALSPNEYQNLVNELVGYVLNQNEVDFLNMSSFKQTVMEFLIIPYFDFYLEEYAQKEPKLEDYSPSSDVLPNYKTVELSPEQKQRVFDEHEAYLEYERRLEEFRKMNPGADRIQQEKEKQQIKKTTPEEWHSILFQ